MTIYASQVPNPDNSPRVTPESRNVTPTTHGLVVCTYCEGTQVDPLCSVKGEENLATLAPCPACAGEGMRAVPLSV